MSQYDKIVDKAVDNLMNIFYSKDKKYVRILLGLVLVGFVLRVVAAIHEGVLADDMLYASQSAGIIGSGIISTHSNPALFFYLTDLAYKIFGYTTLASRLLPLIAGTLLIVVVFLITRKLFNEKVALGAAFFATFSNFLVRMTFSEQSLVVFFFCFFAIYLGMLYLDTKKIEYILASGIVFGLAALTKYNAPFFIFSFLVFSAYYVRQKKEIFLTKRNAKRFGLFLLIIALLSMPFLAFNYLLYHDKGIVDIYFSRIFTNEKSQQLYGSLAGQDKTFFDNLTTLGMYSNYKLVYQTDLLLLLFAVAGVILWARRKERNALAFFFIFLAIPFILQSGGSALNKHFVFMHVLFAIPAGYALVELMKKIKNKTIFGVIVLAILALMILNLGNTVGTPQGYFQKSSTAQLKSWINSEVGSSDLLVFDSRIYTATVFWEATPHYFLNFDQFYQFYQYNQNISGPKVQTKVHVIECALDDCGWGWVSSKPDFNASAEGFVDAFRNISRVEKTISAADFRKNEVFTKGEVRPNYVIYETTFDIDRRLLEQISQVQQFYFTPYMYKNMNSYILSYKTEGIGTMLDSLSRIIVYAAMVLALIAFIAVFFLL